ncbi:MAG TPA: methylated-DNA--[protein]-cysteine S-methyltransferase [Casimicrobiaceae bacterium]|nr:methylated-DNA--[protein]-cysteine S-methyltransferase [Casimicrobiaceae bacterium]
MLYRDYATPLGTMRGTTDGLALLSLEFDPLEANPHEAHDASSLLDDLGKWLVAYFAGDNPAFPHPLAPRGTAFQKDVWRALQAIPYGRTVSYLDIACKVGRPSVVRAVGAANGRNPIAIIVPCHRVIGSNGTLTGYAGGLTRKQSLLALEQREAFALVA